MKSQSGEILEKKMPVHNRERNRDKVGTISHLSIMGEIHAHTLIPTFRNPKRDYAEYDNLQNV
jgi:hypothetical protein